MGQKQLITVARCLLSQRRIVLIDEATASIDKMTEELI
jgi:ATP-binding cassette subfamily B protein